MAGHKVSKDTGNQLKKRKPLFFLFGTGIHRQFQHATQTRVFPRATGNFDYFCRSDDVVLSQSPDDFCGDLVTQTAETVGHRKLLVLAFSYQVNGVFGSRAGSPPNQAHLFTGLQLTQAILTLTAVGVAVFASDGGGSNSLDKTIVLAFAKNLL